MYTHSDSLKVRRKQKTCKIRLMTLGQNLYALKSNLVNKENPPI